jgi:hypothetical protein
VKDFDDANGLVVALTLLREDLRAAVPSALGFRVTLVQDGIGVTVTAVDSDQQVASSLRLALWAFLPLERGSVVTFYAGAPGTFVELNTDFRQILRLVDGESGLDEDLPGEALRPGVEGADDLIVVNRAVGALIEQGHSPGGAQHELVRLARSGDQTLLVTAHELVVQLPGRGPRP